MTCLAALQAMQISDLIEPNKIPNRVPCREEYYAYFMLLRNSMLHQSSARNPGVTLTK